MSKVLSAAAALLWLSVPRTDRSNGRVHERAALARSAVLESAESDRVM
jgi:hypothetical protein